MKKEVTVLSLGAGVQSSAMLLMADRGELGYTPDFAVFADTQCEPPEVMTWLEKLKENTKIPIIVATRGNLYKNIMDKMKSNGSCVGLPFFLKKENEKSGMGIRQCTVDYKIDVVNRSIREKLGYKKCQRVKHKVHVLIGISTNEASRMKMSVDKWKEHHWPLIDKRMNRQDCIKYVESTGIGTPPRSACIICPYKSNYEWKRLKVFNPDLFEMACQLDDVLRNENKRWNGLPYLHFSMVPLRDADVEQRDQVDMFQNDCQGMCGV